MPKTLKLGWYVLYVRSCHEKKVHDLLIRNQLVSYLPLVQTIRQWSDRKKTISKPLFPSYVFVKIRSTMDFHEALSIEGACAFIRFGNEYALATDIEINKIKVLVEDEHITDVEMKTDLPKIGDIKKISHGPLSGLECEILKVNNVNKIIVRIDSLQQNIIATIPSYLFSNKRELV